MGDETPKKRGRKKGVPNRRTLWLYEQLKANDACIFEEMAKAIKTRDIELIRALTPVIQYVSPKPKELEDASANMSDALAFEELKKLAHLAKDDDEET